jgi:hypothetical protein
MITSAKSGASFSTERGSEVSDTPAQTRLRVRASKTDVSTNAMSYCRTSVIGYQSEYMPYQPCPHIADPGAIVW